MSRDYKPWCHYHRGKRNQHPEDDDPERKKNDPKEKGKKKKGGLGGAGQFRDSAAGRGQLGDPI